MGLNCLLFFALMLQSLTELYFRPEALSIFRPQMGVFFHSYYPRRGFAVKNAGKCSDANFYQFREPAGILPGRLFRLLRGLAS